jgi:dimethylhistidine N-methyltransferase
MTNTSPDGHRPQEFTGQPPLQSSLPGDANADERAELLRGLRDRPKHVAARYLYDAAGSQLFDAICALPEYYPTRTETAILRAHLGEIAASIGERALLVEPGSGSSTKTRLLLDALPNLSGYVPVDISGEHLEQAARRLARAYPALEILPVCADFTAGFTLPMPTRRRPSRVVLFFPGSTIGNFEPEDAVQLLANLREVAGRGAGLLVGVDLVKAPEIIERAYNDSAGVTARFNLNLLSHLNREFGGDFDPATFSHRAAWDPRHERIEMQLVSRYAQAVHIAGATLRFEAGEPLRTEYCHKFRIADFGALARRAGWRSVDVWTDARRLFSVHYLVGD